MYPSRQSGFVLITSIMFMLVLTLVVVYAVRSATIYERVAGNNRNYSQAFQAAEFALQQARGTLVDIPTIPSTNSCISGLCGKDTDISIFNNPENWISNSNLNKSCAVNDSCNTSGASKAISFPGASSQQPRYIIKELNSSGSCAFYEITAFGKGGNASSGSILRSVVKACDS
ncbi:pilus assembly PilX family protein [Chitinolyticbacter meiyuanensis]|uniref:pilus assembly PilX family protein n=1 Tax=Chitinolyticbacter meiyuanensis TaxID=682798 RepID=UPI0011E59A2A|nr:PilX N-terminal domain-containing pilus assembly protein [Chitinolyticbacter meiyuanensis]